MQKMNTMDRNKLLLEPEFQDISMKEIKSLTLNESLHGTFKWVSRILLLSWVLLGLSIIPAFSQEKTITGTVTSVEDGEPMIGVTVFVKGTTKGTVTNFDGTFTLNVQPTDTVVFSFVGMETQQYPASEKDIFDIILELEKQEIAEVVVTAMGIKREKKALGYATQEISGDQVAASGQEDVTKALQGKIAGVSVKQVSGMPGEGAQITIRGNNSLSLSNQPLYVVDGMPIESSNPFSYGTSGTGASNRSLDLNPDDIESITVLKGPTAAALYGLRASNGVVVITTKSGKAAEKAGQKTIVTFNSSYSMDKVSRLPDLQNKYAQGVNDSLDQYSSYSWGPLIDTLKPYQAQEEAYGYNTNSSGIYDFPVHGQATNVPQRYDNITPFFQTGHSFKNSIDISTASDLGNYSLGFAAANQQGIIPTTGMQKYNAKFNGLFNMNEKMKMGASVNYSNSHIDKVPSGSSRSNPLFSLYSAPISYNLEGTPYSSPNNPYIQNHYRTGVDNPYWALQYNNFYEETKRVFGNVNFLYDPFEWMNVSYRIGIDNFTTVQKDNYSLGSGIGRGYDYLPRFVSSFDSIPSGGEVKDLNYLFNGINSTLLLTFNKKINDKMRIDWIVGNELYDKKTRIQEVLGLGVNVAGFSNISGTSNQISTQKTAQQRGYAYFTTFTLDYNGMLYFTPSGRADVVSSMPEGKRTFFYPSVSSGFIFTKLKALEDNKLLQYGKIRASYAQVGQAGDVYSTRQYYVSPTLTSSMISTLYTFPYYGSTAFSNLSILYSGDIEPQNTKTMELGTEIRLLDNRIGIDYTYYIANSTKQIFKVPLAPSTGYYEEYRNAGEIKNTGHEIILNLKPVKNDRFSWDFQTNFSTFKSIVKSLAEGVERIKIDEGFSSVGVYAYANQAFPVLFGSKYVRDDNGNVVVDSRDSIDGKINPFYGLPLTEGGQDVLAKVNPDFEMSFINTFTYKDVSLSFQVDWRKGGHMFSGLNSLLDAYGMSDRTENREEYTVIEGSKGYYDNTGNLVLEGANDISVQKKQVYYDEVLWNIAEAYVYNTSFVRLREITIDYTLPDKWLKNTKVTSARVFLSGHNLFLITNYPYFDPESTTSRGNGAGGIEYVALPNTRSFGGGIKLTF